jgi:uncharacterized protein with NRDE domain
MCIVLAAYDCHPKYLLILAANRDEYYDRPAAQAGFWEERPDVLAGRDLQSLGTWLGITRRGRFAVLTNYRDPSSQKENTRSRGLLVRDFLCSLEEAGGYLEALHKSRGQYNGFNLLLLDGKQVWYYGSRTGRAGKVVPGIHGLSNHLLNTPWPKVVRGKEGLRGIAGEGGEVAVESLFSLLADRRQAEDGELPHTGVSLECERMLSPIFIQSEIYGTRASTVILIDRRGRVRFYERVFGAGGRPAGGGAYEFSLTEDAEGPPVALNFDYEKGRTG